MPGWVRTATGIVILLVVLGSFVRRTEQTVLEVRQVWQPVSWLYVAASLALLLTCLFVMALLWYGLLHTISGRLSLLTAVQFYGLSLLPRYLPGMVWGYVGRTLLCERAGITRKVAVASTVAEVGLLVSSGALLAAMKYLGWGWMLLPVLPGVIVALGFILATLMSRHRWISQLRRVGTWYAWGLAYVAFWALYGLSIWYVVLSVDRGIGVALLPDVAASAILAWLGGFVLVLVPAGLGVREGLFALTLAPILGPTKGLLVPLMARLIGLSAEAVFFTCCASFSPRRWLASDEHRRADWL